MTAETDIPADVLPFLQTLRRLPDDVVLSMATREMVMGEPCSCLCGRAWSDAMLAKTGIQTMESWPDRRLQEMFGGAMEEWEEVFMGVIRDHQKHLIEEAFTIRLEEAVANG